MEDEDDTHFCLKCNTPIVGLENYVAHRKSGCPKNIVEPSKSSLPSQLLPPDEIGFEADDFFSSLELRSSSKKPVVQSPSGKSFSGILTRSKISAAIQATTPQKEAEPSKSGKNVWIGGNQLKDLGTGDNQSKLIEAVAHLERQKNSNSNSQSTSTVAVYGDSDEHDSEEYEYDEDDSSEDEEPGEDLLGRLISGKWKPGCSPLEWGNNTNRSGDRDWNEPSPSFTGGKWVPKSPLSPSYAKGRWKPSEDDGHPTTGGKYPSPGHIKGKLKSKLDNEDDRYPPSPHTKAKVKPKVDDDNMALPPSHPKGKWKPKLFEDVSMTPPTSPTKGKGKPKELENISPKEKERSRSSTGSSRSSTGSSSKDKLKYVATKPSKFKPSRKWTEVLKPKPVKRLKMKKNRGKEKKVVVKKTKNDSSPSNSENPIFCYPCNRALASKLVYNRHLKSKLHFKRVAAERELDNRPIIKKAKIEEEPGGLPVEEPICLPEVELNRLPVEEPSGISIVEPVEIEPSTSNQMVKKRRKRRNIYETCVVCRSKVYKNFWGKHLISHYHFTKGDMASKAAKNLVLKNILSIVVECPFQCAMCKFYCNNHNRFLDHWRSKFHDKHDKNYSGYYSCAFCSQQCQTSGEMLEHLNSPHHLEVIAIINRSVPIIIKKIREIFCLTCRKSFILNIQLTDHCRQTGHDSSNISIGNNYKCSQCNKTFSNAMSLQKHSKMKHGHETFFCGICKMEFKTSDEAKTHRRTLDHRYASLAKRKPNSLKRDCQYCERSFENFLLLKEHLKSDHPDHHIRCPHCGANFTISQELSNHLRSKSCKFPEDSDKGPFHCKICPFSSDSKSEYYFHAALHTEPLIIEESEEKGNRSNAQPVARYRCPLCGKLYPKYSLKPHLRLHTKERPYTCKTCDATFTRKSNLLYHEKNHKKKQVCPKKKPEDATYLCSTCGARFNKKFTLHQHMLVHTGKLYKCPNEGCSYAGRKASELNEHLKIHGSEKNYACTLCEYKGKTEKQLKRHMTVHSETKQYSCSLCSFKARFSAHLKRHLRLHTGAKPFKCPYCVYKCNNMENLRRHILTTSKHPEKCVYECKFCESERFQTNLAKEFKAHIIQTHKEKLGDGVDAAGYVSGIYQADKDDTDLISLEERIDDPDPLHEAGPSTSTNGFSKMDPVVAQVAQSSGNVAMDEVSPMFGLIGQYDVDESGDLVRFQSGQDLFQAHF